MVNNHSQCWYGSKFFSHLPEYHNFLNSAAGISAIPCPVPIPKQLQTKFFIWKLALNLNSHPSPTSSYNHLRTAKCCNFIRMLTPFSALFGVSGGFKNHSLPCIPPHLLLLFHLHQLPTFTCILALQNVQIFLHTLTTVHPHNLPYFRAMCTIKFFIFFSWKVSPEILCQCIQISAWYFLRFGLWTGSKNLTLIKKQGEFWSLGRIEPLETNKQLD